MVMRRTTWLHPEPMTTHVRVPVDDSRTEAGLGAALDALVGVAWGVPRALGENEGEEVPPFLVVTFHGGGRWLTSSTYRAIAGRSDAARCELGPAVNEDVDAFARLVHAESKRERYRALYVANAGRGLFADAPGRFARWLEFFEARGLAFEGSHRELVAPNLYAPKPRGEAWESASSCTERD